MNYVIRKRCAQKITTFYRNVSKKYKHTYSLDLMEKNINDAFDAIYQIKHARQLRLSEGRASLFTLAEREQFRWKINGCFQSWTLKLTVYKQIQNMADILKKEVNLLPALMQEVENKIAVIRGVEVIADADVAALYGVETREVNQAVKNNTDKFPPHYMFELSHSELRDLKSKILISKVSNNNRKLTKVFTERGLYMLATVLKGERARQVTFAIIETFAKVRNLKRELVELHQETDKEKQASKMNMTRTCPSSSHVRYIVDCIKEAIEK